MNFLKQLILSIGVRGITLCCGLVTSILISRILGPEGKGIQAAIMTLNTLAIQIASFGLFSANTFFSSRQPEYVSKIAVNSLWIGIIGGSIVAWGCYLLATHTSIIFADPNIISPFYIAIGVLLIPLTFVVISYQQILLGLQDYTNFNRIELFLRITTLVGIIIALLLTNSITGMFSALVLATCFGLIYSIFILHKKSGFAHYPDLSLFQKMLGYGLRAYIANLLTILVLRSDILIVNALLGVEVTGIYSVSVQCADLLSIVPGVLATLYFPKVAALTTQRDILTPLVVRIALPLMLVMCLVAGFVAWLGIPLAFGARFQASVVPFLLLLPGTLALSLELIIAQDIASRDYPLAAVLLWVPICIGNIALTYALLPRIGVSGASIASSLSYITAFILMSRLFIHYTGCSLQDLTLLRREDLFLLRDRLIGSLQKIDQEAS